MNQWNQHSFLPNDLHTFTARHANLRMDGTFSVCLSLSNKYWPVQKPSPPWCCQCKTPYNNLILLCELPDSPNALVPRCGIDVCLLWLPSCTDDSGGTVQVLLQDQCVYLSTAFWTMAFWGETDYILRVCAESSYEWFFFFFAIISCICIAQICVLTAYNWRCLFSTLFYLQISCYMYNFLL